MDQQTIYETTIFAHEEKVSASSLTSFTTSFLAILVSQIGDKTFFIAMIWAMRYSKLLIFSGAFGALAIMTILSALFGKILPKLLSKFFTDLIVTVLFFYFGFKMLYDAYNLEDGDGQSDERKSVSVFLFRLNINCKKFKKDF